MLTVARSFKMQVMTADRWPLIAELARERRTELRLTQLQVAIAAHTSESTIRAIERAGRTTYQPSTLRGISEALRWTPDSIDRILAGKDPIAAQDDEEGDDDRLARLERRVAELERERSADDDDPPVLKDALAKLKALEEQDIPEHHKAKIREISRDLREQFLEGDPPADAVGA